MANAILNFHFDFPHPSLIDHPALQPGPSCSPSCGAPSRQPPWVRGWSRLSPLETSTRGCRPSSEDVMDGDGDGGRPWNLDFI